ncbi:3'-5' exonuclease [Microbulbifer rhizosphaerae]|uniref:Inhibitor of KinA sporulation pathway (Predicted exonuclease) n=1 Tax=Microbulbifer rhizosphaerae TaxID=1562603 RepID=A0A7W4W9F9_9GAMM|nr:3'-5' exonuclease [Microbulbifer rhizosphaerae]MBB3060064.1 inhibitor of KinA sporulation pathway (predicted exonuclease) [Microbulbifer rhizosphaerae]
MTLPNTSIRQLLIVDLEATCWDDRPQSVEVMEVIEFGLALATLEGEILASHSQLVRPTINPELSDFCCQLTGIDRDQVAAAPGFAEATSLLDDWLQGLEYQAWASWGQYDSNQIRVEQARHNCAPAFFSKPHINLKALWQEKTGKKRHSGLGSVLQSLGLTFEGRLHRGEDDARNIARILPSLASHIQPGSGKP